MLHNGYGCISVHSINRYESTLKGIRHSPEQKTLSCIIEPKDYTKRIDDPLPRVPRPHISL